MSSYSLDLRARIVKASVEEGQSPSEVARRFGLSRWSVRRYLKRAAAGSLAPTPHPGRVLDKAACSARASTGPVRKQRLDNAACEVLRKQVEMHHDWSLAQHAEAIGAATGVELKKSSVGNYLKRLGISYKKKLPGE